MGCITSNTAAYPGNNRVAKPVYQPPESDYKQVDSTIAVANVHFVTCPGGNALKLVGKPNRTEDPVGSGREELAKYISGMFDYSMSSWCLLVVNFPLLCSLISPSCVNL